MVITIGVVPAVLASIVTIIVTILCVVKQKWLLDYKLKCLAINHTDKYIMQLQEQIKKEKRPHVLKKLVKLMDIAFDHLLDQNVGGQSSKPLLTFSQASVESVDFGEIKVNGTEVKSSRQLSIPMDSNGIVLAKTDVIDSREQPASAQRQVSFQRRPSMERMEQIDQTQFDQVTNMFAAFISKAVRDSLLHAPDRNPSLATHVEREVKSAMFKRQQSIGSTGSASFMETQCYRCYQKSVSDNGEMSTLRVEKQSTLLHQNTE